MTWKHRNAMLGHTQFTFFRTLLMASSISFLQELTQDDSLVRTKKLQLLKTIPPPNSFVSKGCFYQIILLQVVQLTPGTQGNLKIDFLCLCLYIYTQVYVCVYVFLMQWKVKFNTLTYLWLL